MADAKPAAAPPVPAAGKAEAGKKKGGGTKLIICMTLFGAMVPFLMPTLLLLVCMLPTLVAILTETGNRKGSSVMAIAAMNAAGIVPFVIDLWAKGQTMEHAYLILGNSQTWLVVLAAAATGKLILFAVPQVIAGATLANAENRVKRLKDNLEMLKMTWGPEVATTKPVEKMGRGE